MKEFKTLIWCLLGLVSASSLSAAITPQQLDFFEKKIRPLLVEECYSCHSAAEGKKRGGLVLDSRAGWEKGGDSGTSIVPGDPDASLFIQAVRYSDAGIQMPPKKQLAANQVEDLVAWVRMGAPDPRDGVTAEVSMSDLAQKHWAFKPIQNPSVPAVKNTAWVGNPIDAFIAAKQEEKQLRPSPRADHRTLIRRAYFDLHGVPPTAEEFAKLLKDDSSKAWGKMIDDLLDSEHYGERWGRFWLDLARYADTKGDVNRNEDFRYPYAWTYRDWVIQSFNEDKPYNRFVMEQIAADLLPDRNGDKDLAALGFLTVGKRFNGDGNEIIDDRIDVVTKGLMGLTVVCARCHDHKFDPIPTADYYSLHGIFASSQEPGVEQLPVIARPSDTRAYMDFQRELVRRENEAELFRANLESEIRQELREKAAVYMLTTWEVRQPTNDLNQAQFAAAKGLDGNVLNDWQNYLRNSARKHDPVFAPWNEFSRLSAEEFAEKAPEIAARYAANNDESKPINKLVSFVFKGAPPRTIVNVAERYDRLFKEAERRWMKEIVAANRARREPPKKMDDPQMDQLRAVLFGQNMPCNPTGGRIFRLIPMNQQNEEQRLKARVAELRSVHPGAPGRAMMLVDRPNPRDSRVFIRGNARNLGDVAPRQWLSALSGDQREPFKIGSGRLELARNIASKDNPLTARVFVNRVWMHHFGEGIVRTPSDFGTRADDPSHPELLDWLTTWFIDNGWSAKKLHRLIMTSNTYQQTSEDNPRFAQIDPANDLLWRYNVRRLDFEALRDTLLAIGGKLDRTLGGKPVNLLAEPYPTRRTVYGFINRNNLASLFSTFDFANPDLSTGQRYETTVPQQALFLMNSPLVVEQARNLVTRGDFQAMPKNEDKVRMLYNLIYQRTPNASEEKLAMLYLEAQAGRKLATPDADPWMYGYGYYDPRSQRVTGFNLMEVFRQRTYAPSGQPSRAQGALSLTQTGGQPGFAPQYAAIRRFTAQADGFLDIVGYVRHTEDQGDGIAARIVHSRRGLLGQWAVKDQSVDAGLKRVAVQKGDTIDFVVDMYRQAGFDNFEWAPEIRQLGNRAPGASANDRMMWNARNDFGPPPEGGFAIPMNIWEKYAQVLMLTNEMTFYN